MRPLLLGVLAILAGTFFGCAPTMHQMLIMDTAAYTDCDHVEVDCADPDCSNVAGGPWMATACGTRYKCHRVGDNVTCVPQDSAAPAPPAMPGSVPPGSLGY